MLLFSIIRSGQRWSPLFFLPIFSSSVCLFSNLPRQWKFSSLLIVRFDCFRVYFLQKQKRKTSSTQNARTHFSRHALSGNLPSLATAREDPSIRAQSRCSKFVSGDTRVFSRPHDGTLCSTVEQTTAVGSRLSRDATSCTPANDRRSIATPRQGNVSRQ